MSEQRDITSVYGRRDSDPGPRRNAPAETTRWTDGGVECEYKSTSYFRVTEVDVMSKRDTLQASCGGCMTLRDDIVCARFTRLPSLDQVS